MWGRYGDGMKAESRNGSIEVLDGGVVIKSKGGSKTIPFSGISGVEFKKAGLTAGYLRLSIPGSADVKGSSSLLTNKNYQMQQDPNAIQFTRGSKNAEFEAVADAINRALLSKAP